MATCPTCNNFYMGAECPFCRIERLDPEKVRLEEERKKREEEQLIRKQNEELLKVQYALQNSGQYEYSTEYLYDSRSGVLAKSNLDAVLTKYANAGWRLHSIITNEAGKNASSVGIGGITVGSNSTMDVTILIFERCLKIAGDF